MGQIRCACPGSDPIGGLLAGKVQSTIDDVLLPALTTDPGEFGAPDTLAGKVFHQADVEQEFAGVATDPGTTCEPQGPGDETIPVSQDPEADSAICGSFIKSMRVLLQDALGPNGLAGPAVGVPASAFPQLWRDTALATRPVAPNSKKLVYKNFRCVPRVPKLHPKAPPVNVCRYVLPARRINVLPDGVELVFVDDDKEYANPSFVGWLIALNLQLHDNPGSPINPLHELCDSPHHKTPGTTFRRLYSNAEWDSKHLTVDKSICTQQQDGTYVCPEEAVIVQ